MFNNKEITPLKTNLIAMTNAGYAEIQGQNTMGLIDGIASVTGCKRGNNSFAEIHSRYDAPLWCAIYDKVSGYCVYLQVVDSNLPSLNEINNTTIKPIFTISMLEKIDAAHLYKHSELYDKKFRDKIFGGNEFRIIAIANAIAHNAPIFAIKSF